MNDEDLQLHYIRLADAITREHNSVDADECEVFADV